jgi:hypothetical protein
LPVAAFVGAIPTELSTDSTGAGTALPNCIIVTLTAAHAFNQGSLQSNPSGCRSTAINVLYVVENIFSIMTEPCSGSKLKALYWLGGTRE